MNNNHQHASTVSLILWALLVTACIPIFDTSPIGRHEMKVDHALTGKWVTEEGEKVNIIIENNRYKIDYVDFAKSRHLLSGHSGKIGDKNIFVIEVINLPDNIHGTDNIAQKRTTKTRYIIFNYTLSDDNQIKIYPIDGNAIGELIDADSISDTIVHPCQDQFSTGLPKMHFQRVIASPDVIRKLVLDRTRNIFREESITLIRQHGANHD